jgi:hypothetical protein
MMTAAILAGVILTTREISYVDEIGARIHFVQCRGLCLHWCWLKQSMTSKSILMKRPPEQTALRLPVAAQSGAAFTLQLRRPEIHQLWDFYQPFAIRSQPAFGVQ